MIQNNKQSFNKQLTKVKTLCFLAFFLLFQPINNSYSQEVPAPPIVTQEYKVFWLNSHIGDVKASINKEESSYKISSQLSSRGLPRKLFKFWMHTYSTSNYTEDNHIVPHHSKTESRLRKTYRVIELSYNPTNGELDTESVTPPDNRDKRPAVPDILKYHAVDPHTAILLAHQHVHLALKYNYKRFSIPIYDGRRRANLYFTVIGKEEIKIHDKPTKTIHIQLQRDVLSGATKKERERMKEEEPIIDIYLEDNDKLLPLKAIARAPIGSVVAIIKR